MNLFFGHRVQVMVLSGGSWHDDIGGWRQLRCSALCCCNALGCMWRDRATGLSPRLISAAPVSEKASIAVLPFLNMSGNPQQEY